MRNLLEYPVTVAEILACLEALEFDLSRDIRPGDMRPLLLHEARKRVATTRDLPVNEFGDVE